MPALVACDSGLARADGGEMAKRVSAYSLNRTRCGRHPKPGLRHMRHHRAPG